MKKLTVKEVDDMVMRYLLPESQEPPGLLQKIMGMTLPTPPQELAVNQEGLV